jgi:hypothetical protein
VIIDWLLVVVDGTHFRVMGLHEHNQGDIIVKVEDCPNPSGGSDPGLLLKVICMLFPSVFS